jgi:hypothetical protein
MVLITNKSSNILQDIDTLSLFARVVAEYCRTQTEKEIIKQAFELLAVFDEIISLGLKYFKCRYRENVSLGQIRTISAMESHEERIQAEIAREKEKEAKEETKRKARAIDQKKRDDSRKDSRAINNKVGYGNSGGSSGGFTPNNSGGFPQFSPVYQHKEVYLQLIYSQLVTLT